MNGRMNEWRNKFSLCGGCVKSEIMLDVLVVLLEQAQNPESRWHAVGEIFPQEKS